jgi:hypothetical protein
MTKHQVACIILFLYETTLPEQFDWPSRGSAYQIGLLYLIDRNCRRCGSRIIQIWFVRFAKISI